MADPLYELLITEDHNQKSERSDLSANTEPTPTISKYLSRLLSLHPSDLNTTEPQSLSQSLQTSVVSLQALSSRSHRSTTASHSQLSSLQEYVPSITRTATELRNALPQLDSLSTQFASTYSKHRGIEDNTTGVGGNINDTLKQRKDSMLFTRQAEKLQDIIELPNLLSATIASAATGPAGTANYTQALDLYAHIKRLQILYPDSKLIADLQIQADEALKEMTTKLVASLRGQNLRLAAAIRTVGWLKRVVPELSDTHLIGSKNRTGPGSESQASTLSFSQREEEQAEGSFGALFLVARLATFLSMTEDALAPLRDLADQETEKRLRSQATGENTMPQITRRPSAHAPMHAVQGQQTERYLKRYIEIFREQSFTTVQMYRNIFPSASNTDHVDDMLQLPSALASFPLHLVGLLMETLQKYLPNVTDDATRESLLIQVLYAANSMGRLGADFSMMISLLDLPGATTMPSTVKEEADPDKEDQPQMEPEWYRAIKKHRIQAARLDALASGQENAARRASQDVEVR